MTTSIPEFEWSEFPWPEFNGDYLSYGLFKSEFNTLADTVYVMRDCDKLYYLYKCLKGTVLTETMSLFKPGNYANIWEYLDKSYNNKWMVITSTLVDFLCMQTPKEDPTEIEKYWYTAINKLRSILTLELTPDQVFANYLIQSLPKNLKYESKLIYEWIEMDKEQHELVEKVYRLVLEHIERMETFCQKSDVTKEKSNPDASQLSVRFRGLELRAFHGDLLSYTSFKIDFSDLAGWGKRNGMSDQQLLVYLKKAIKGDALIYIGSRGPQHDSCDKMWKYLDKKYNNKWLETTEVLKNFKIQNVIPTKDLEDIKTYWRNAINNVRRILCLNLNLEQLFINYIVQRLPKSFQLELLKRLQLEHMDKNMYGIEEATDSFNGAIAVRKMVQVSLGSSADINIRGHISKENSKFHGNSRGNCRGRGRRRY